MSGDLHPGLGTLSVRAGEEESILQGATQVPVVHSVSFGYSDVDHWLSVARGRAHGYIYSRNTNPTVHAFEEKEDKVLEDLEKSVAYWKEYV